MDLIFGGLASFCHGAEPPWDSTLTHSGVLSNLRIPAFASMKDRNEGHRFQKIAKNLQLTSNKLELT